VLVSVLTSAFITLAVEWPVKPQREAPKERLLACTARAERSKKPSYILGNAVNLATGAHTESHEALRRNCGALSELRPTVPRLKSKLQRRICPIPYGLRANLCDGPHRNRIIRYVFTARVFTIYTRTQVIKKADMPKGINNPNKQLAIRHAATYRSRSRLRNSPQLYTGMAKRQRQRRLLFPSARLSVPIDARIKAKNLRPLLWLFMGSTSYLRFFDCKCSLSAVIWVIWICFVAIKRPNDHWLIV